MGHFLNNYTNIGCTASVLSCHWPTYNKEAVRNCASYKMSYCIYCMEAEDTVHYISSFEDTRDNFSLQSQNHK